jgi:hypothetical protein
MRRSPSRDTKRYLKALDSWEEWKAVFDLQLDQHYEAGTFLDPIPRPIISPSGGKPQILRIVWSNIVKPSGKRKCCACLDGSKRSAPQLRNYRRTYASCVEQPCQVLFFAVAASQNKLVTFADTTNAFQQAPPPTEQCYLEIDDDYTSWYLKRLGKDIDRAKYVIPLGRALQGHLEAGALWEQMANSILKDPKLGFKATTHERNLYHGVVRGETVYICHQVDDFSIASDTCATADHIISVVNSHATTTSQGIGETTRHGEHCCYNGVDICRHGTTSRSLAKPTLIACSRLIIGTFQPITRATVMTVSRSLWMELRVYSYYRVLQKTPRSTQHLKQPWVSCTDKYLVN